MVCEFEPIKMKNGTETLCRNLEEILKDKKVETAYDFTISDLIEIGAVLSNDLNTTSIGEILEITQVIEDVGVDNGLW